MRGIDAGSGTHHIFVENLGIIKTSNHSYFMGGGAYNSTAIHFIVQNNGSHLTLGNYLIKIIESQSEFNDFKTYGDRTNNKNSHLIVWHHASNIDNGFMPFKDGDSKIILDFGGEFQLDKVYKIDRLVVFPNSGSPVTTLGLDFSRLTTKTSLYKLTQSGEYFIVSFDAPNSEIGILNKSNVRTMNNFMTMSNSMIYPHKQVGLNRVVKKKRMIRRVKKMASLRKNERSEFSWQTTNLDSYDSWIASSAMLPRNDEFLALESLKSHESFAYKNNSTDSTNRRRIQTNQTTKTTIPSAIQNKSNYYFILIPFINHNLFFQSGRYNLSGFDYGFLTAFSARVAESNSLGAHFMMSYGTLSDSSDKDFRISNLNLNLGVNYKLDLVWDMYVKARGDFFYFLNQVKTLTMINAIKPNNLGFGVSVSYGKDFDFKQGGILGIEGGIDYKALSASEITLDSMSETYQKSLYNLLYLDLGISYVKYFGSFGLNANLGIKGNITANKLAKSKISLNNFNRNVDMVLDNDNVLGYANVGLSYVLNHKNFDMEFSLAYYGNFGDRIISNGGGFEWCTTW